MSCAGIRTEEFDGAGGEVHDHVMEANGRSDVRRALRRHLRRQRATQQVTHELPAAHSEHLHLALHLPVCIRQRARAERLSNNTCRLLRIYSTMTKMVEL
jgi:hypothetical protein